MEYLRVSHAAYGLERTISHSNLYLRFEMMKKYLESLQMNISNSYYKKVSIAFIFNQYNLFNSSIPLLLTSIFECL